VWSEGEDINYIVGQFGINNGSFAFSEPENVTQVYREIYNSSNPTIQIYPEETQGAVHGLPSSTPHIFWQGMVTDPRCKSGKNCGTHSIIYTAREDGKWKPFTEFVHGSPEEPHEELYPVAAIQKIDEHDYLRCVWQCDEHLTTSLREINDERWGQPYRVDIQGNNLAHPAIVSYDNEESNGRTFGFCTDGNSPPFSLVTFHCNPPPLKFLSSENGIKNGAVGMKNEFATDANEQRRGSVDLSNIKLSGDKEYDLQGALWLTTHSYTHSDEMIAFSQEYTPGKLEDWLGTEAFTVGTDDAITMNNQFSLVDFSAAEVDSVLSTPLFLIDVYDA
jgi:hypothetical protein